MSLSVRLPLAFISLVLIGFLDETASPAVAREDISHGGARIVHQGGGLFLVAPTATVPDTPRPGGAATIDLERIRHGHDPARDPDVPATMNVTFGDRHPRLVDAEGRGFALITLYQVDPPLADLPSGEPGVDRGIDMRSPADMVKSAYSNYVSPVVTDDAERRPVPSHPIGHFFVKLEIGGYPTVLTGMTTTRRADEELVDLTLGHKLGLGGVLLSPQPGRLNAAAEVREELQLRQRRLRVIDGVQYKRAGERNVGPEYVIEDGNVVFARFKVPESNAKDALAAFVEFLWRGQHNVFGSLLNRPYKGTGSGCSAFAVMWLKAAGVIPFVREADSGAPIEGATLGSPGAGEFWRSLHRTLYLPWDHVGCDRRVGAARPHPARYTIYDLLFHDEPAMDLIGAIPGLAEKLRADYGTMAATLFAFGALTPLRNLFIAMKREDPLDTGDYRWAANDEGLQLRFWDNARFSGWVKGLWRKTPPPPGIELAREGRFLGIVVDAMDRPRQREPFFAVADRMQADRERDGFGEPGATSCRALFLSGPH